MKYISKIGLCLLFTLGIVSFAQAQIIKTISGNVCSSEHSQDETGGVIRLRVGDKILEIYHTFSPTAGDYTSLTKRQMQKFIRENTTKYYGSKSLDERTGAELIVKYKENNSDYWAISITSTGKKKKIKSCSNE